MPHFYDTEFNEHLARRVAGERLKDAENRRLDAAHSGAMHDGGASAIKSEADAFLCGLDRRWPEGWQIEASKMAVQMERERDPDWKTFQRLKAKFES